ncbi:MAG: hypothetical protein NXI31_14635 [bacterium]|nr:hypothetical protein [bacterium]
MRDGLGADIDSQEVTTSLFANWDTFVDPEGSPVLYEWSVGTVAGRDDVLEWTRVGGATRASMSVDGSAADGRTLPTDRLLFVNVRATDVQGNRSRMSSSDGLVLGVTGLPFTAIGTRPGGTGDGRGNQAGTTAGEVAQGYHLAIERFGTTWTFAEPAICGRFVNGDWWVLGPVDVVGITPRSRRQTGRGQNGRVLHGSMANPDPTRAVQGYDSAMFGPDREAGYDHQLNVAHRISQDSPLHLDPGTSLISATSRAEAGALPQLVTAAVLTVLAERPPADAFRPPYCGSDKTPRWRAGDVDLGKLARLGTVAGAPDPRDLLVRFERVWLDHIPGWRGRYLHPNGNMPDYGRDIATLVGDAALALQLGHPEDRTRPLALAMIQLGIDCYGIVQAGGRFVADGASGAGRKFAVVFAGTLLGDAELLRCARERKLAFAEDVQTFYVESTGQGEVNGGHGGYGPRDIGLAEWGQMHHVSPEHDRKGWTADVYRRNGTANTWVGFVLAARAMGLQEAWGHDALFDYMDRYLQTEPRNSWTRSWSPFAERMWDTNRIDH